MLMKNNFQSKSVPRGTRTIWRYLGALLILFTFAIGNVMADEIFSWTATSALAKNASEDATGGTVTCTGSAFGSESPSGSGFYKFNSSTQLTCTLSSGTFAAGDVITFTFTSAGNNKTVGVEIQETSPVTSLTETIATKGTSVSKTYTVTASDGIQGQNKFSIKRVDSNFSLGGVSVTRSSGGGDPVCPETLTISSKDSKTAFTEGEKVELTASLAKGNGDITYQWYKGGTAEVNKLTGKTAAKLEIASCTTADEGSYYCVASKTSCSDAVNSSAFSITVEADTKCFNMPAITSKPSNLASVLVTGGTLSDVSVSGKTVAMDGNGLKFGGNDSRLKVTLTGASIIAGTKITVAWKGASAGSAGVGLFNENLASQVISVSGGEAAGSVSHTFTAEEAANYADEFIINRNASGSGICINAITVEDCGPAIVKHTVTLNYNDGETPAGSLTVVDGNTAVKPADPTRGKYTFLGWFVGDTDNEYVWSTAVTDDITLKAHWQDPWTITFDAGEGSAVADVTVKHNTLAEKPADPTWAGHDFNGWTEGGSPFDWTAPITSDHALVAEWITEVAKYDVEYYDGETKIGTEEQVRADLHPTATGISTDKALYTFVGWYLSSTLEGDPVALNTVTPVEGLKLYGKWNKVYASNADFETYIIANPDEKDNEDKAEAYVKSLNYALSTKTNTTFDANTGSNNGAYAGLKIKNAGTTLSWNVVADKVVELKAGVMVANGSLSINGGAATTIDGGSTSSGDNFKKHYFYSAAEALYVFTTSNGSAEVIKAITMRDPFTVNFEAHGDADPSALQGLPSVTLPDATNGTASLLGWFDAETGGNKIGDAGDSYTPTANITLHAQWEAVSTDARLASITFSSAAGTLSPAFDPEVVNYTYTMPYGTAAVPTITGATSVSAKAQEPQIVSQASAWGETAVIRGVAESSDTKAYNITMKIAPKDGVCLVWADVPADNTLTYNATNSKFYAESDVTLQNSNVRGKDGSAPSGKKFQSNGFLKIALNEGTFLDGDVVALNVTYGTANVMHVFKAQAATSTDVIGEAAGNTDAGLNKVAITEDASTLWLVRGGEYADWNPHVDYVAVYRAMNPVLTAITIDGRAGVIDPLDDKHFNVQIPYEADLANLTIVPTIAWNAPAAENSIVVNDGGAWVEGDNTYKLTDKDGDYTIYTLTLTRDVLKHTVSFNTHGGSAVASELVVDGESLAAAPADPTKDDYLFQGWAETEDGSIVDVTSFTITADKEFHAVWVADGAIKLLDGSTVNHTNFITAVTADETVEFQGNTVNYAKFSGTCSGVNSVKDLTRVIAYNATTNKTKIRISAHNNSTSARNILVKGLVEGASAAVDLATVALGNKEDKVSDWIEFDNAANRTIYIMVSSSAGDVYFTQVKVVESGETPMKQAGEAGYSLNLNKGRFFGTASTDLAFEGLNARLSGDYTALNSGYAKLTSTSMSFTVAAPTLLKVTTNNNKTYYVTEGAAGTDNETAKTGESEFTLTAGTWFITAGASEVQFTNLAFELPKCEQPTITPMSNSDLCEGDAFTALTVSASVLDGGTLHYQWYKEAGADDEAVGTDAASYTPEADGEYYVVVTNRLADHSDNSATSNTITVTHFAAAVITSAPMNQRGEVDDVVTLTVAATGKNVSYKWYTCDEDGSNEVALDPAETGTSLNVTVTAGMNQWYKVIVTSDCGNAEAKAKVSEFQPTTPANVTNSILWDWTSSVWPASGTAAFTNEDAPDYELLADADAIVPNAEGFRSDMLYGKGQYVWRSSDPFFQGSAIKFTSTVAGMVRVYFRSTKSGRTVNVAINGTAAGSRTNSFGWSEYVEVPAGEVEILCTGDGYTRIQKIEFLEEINRREAAWVAPGELGTVCLKDNAKALGAKVFEVMGCNASGYMVFDEILSGEIEAGRPYLFEVTRNGSVAFFKTIGAAHSDDEIEVMGMIGTFDGVTLHPDDGNYCYFSGRHIWRVNDFSVDIPVPAYCCYVNYDELKNHPIAAAAPAPGRRRVIMGVNGKDEAQGFENLNASETPMKVMIDGTLYILRGEKVFDATGRLVK